MSCCSTFSEFRHLDEPSVPLALQRSGHCQRAAHVLGDCHQRYTAQICRGGESGIMTSVQVILTLTSSTATSSSTPIHQLPFTSSNSSFILCSIILSPSCDVIRRRALNSVLSLDCDFQLEIVAVFPSLHVSSSSSIPFSTCRIAQP